MLKKKREIYSDHMIEVVSFPDPDQENQFSPNIKQLLDV